MKYCPVCHIEYSDNAEYCKKCEAYLQKKDSDPKEAKTDLKRLLIVCLCTGGFILFIMLIYYILSVFLLK